MCFVGTWEITGTGGNWRSPLAQLAMSLILLAIGFLVIGRQAQLASWMTRRG